MKVSNHRRLALRLTSVAAAAAFAGASVFIAGPAVAATPPNDAEFAGLNYVALGDSYAAGLGLGNPTGLPVLGCAQSGNDYPHLVAAQLNLALTDSSCSGATIPDVVSAQQSVPGGSAPIQIGSLSAGTDIVTLTIGGNDIGFSQIISDCAAQSNLGPLWTHSTDASCQAYFNAQPVNPVVGALASIQLKLKGALGAIHLAAPNAKIFVVGYPALMPDSVNTPSGGCFSGLIAAGPTIVPNAFPFTDADVPYLKTVQQSLESAMAAATTGDGETYVSSLAATYGNSPCASAGDAYINGVTLSSLSPLAFDPASMHPNAAGATFLQGQVVDAIRAAFPAPAVTPPAGPSTTPTASDDLASTGLDVTGWIELAGLFLLAGGGLVFFRRKYASR